MRIVTSYNPGTQAVGRDLMKLLWISHNIPYPPKTGVLQRNYNLLREAARYAEIHLVAIHQRGILPGTYDFAEAERELRKLCQHVEFAFLSFERTRLRPYWTALRSLFAPKPFAARYMESRPIHRRIRELVRATRFDLAHFDTIGLAGYRADAGGIPSILNHHNIESHLLARRVEFEQSTLRRMFWRIECRSLRRYEQRMCADFDSNFTVSSLDAQRLHEIAPSAGTDVIANGVDIDYFRAGESPVVPGSLIMVSGMNWFPNRDAALHMCADIWPILSARNPALTLTVVGAGAPRELMELARRDRRVVVTGFVDDVRPLMDAAEIYVCPMRDGGGTRLKILDALSMSKPIVSTSVGCEGIAVTPGADVLIADSPEDFARQVERLREDAELRRSISAAARRLAETRYAWPVIGNALDSAYRRIVSSGAAVH